MSPLLRPPFFVALIGLLMACEPETRASTRLMVLVFAKDGTLQPREVHLESVTDLVALEGSVARMVGGTRIVVDPADPQLTALGGSVTEGQLRRALIKDEGRAVRASYIEKDGTLWPTDFHTWNLVSAYYSLERAAAYFRDTGAVPQEDLSPVTVYYFPDFIHVQTGRQPQKDNALFFSPVQALILLPFDTLDMAPLALNAGVLTHEYAHRLFNQRVHQGSAVPEFLTRWSWLTNTTAALNSLKALDEGLADFHAVSASCRSEFQCNTQFLGASFPADVSMARDLNRERQLCMTRELRESLLGSSFEQFTQSGLEYRVGSIFAAALWHAAVRTGQREVLERAILEAYDDEEPTRLGLRQLVLLHQEPSAAFTLGKAANAIAAHISDTSVRRAVCGEFLDQLQLGREELPACPPSTTAGDTCEAIP